MKDVKDVLDSLGIRIVSEQRKADGSTEYNALCPHHHDGTRTDHNPSWWINSESGAFVCFSCGWAGNLSLLLRVKGLDPEQAKRILNKGGRALDRIRKVSAWTEELSHFSKPPMNEARLVAYDDPPEWAMEKRRLNSDVCRLYGIRWITDSNRWVTPIRDPKDNSLMGMQVKEEGGRFFRNLPAGVEKSRTLFGVHLMNGGTTVVTESPLDAAYAKALGFTAVSTFGASISIDQIDLLVARSSSLVLALDNDDAGIKATMNVLGCWKNGKKNRYSIDYSQRIPIRLVDTDVFTKKDLGEMPPPIARAALSETVSSLRYRTKIFS